MADTVKVDKLKTLIAMAQNSVGANSYRNFYAEVNGVERDIMKDGELSCAFFASSVLSTLGLIERFHGTVDGVIYDLKKSGWKEIVEPKEGAVLVWEEKEQAGELHKHIGFYVGEKEAVSNREERTPQKHDWLYDGKRAVTAIFWHESLEI